jgi:hypothetical protein
VPRIRLCDADREKYPGPEWVEVSMSELLDEEAGLIEAIENEWGLTPGEFLTRAARGSMKALRALMWVARRKAGCNDDPRTFRPRTQEFSGVQYESTSAELMAAARIVEEGVERPPANRAERRAVRKAVAPARKRTATSKT